MSNYKNNTFSEKSLLSILNSSCFQSEKGVIEDRDMKYKQYQTFQV